MAAQYKLCAPCKPAHSGAAPCNTHHAQQQLQPAKHEVVGELWQTHVAKRRDEVGKGAEVVAANHSVRDGDADQHEQLEGQQHGRALALACMRTRA
jgi:hypothetical protein